MSVFMFGRLVGEEADAVTYEFQNNAQGPWHVMTIPKADPEAFIMVDEERRREAARVMVKAVRLKRQHGEWPETFTIAS